MDNTENIQKIINESGNNFHCKVIKYFQDKEWYTLVSPYYTDFVTDKPREIDIVVEKPFIAWEFVKKTINVKLYIECKYISQEMVFWFSDKDFNKSREWILTHTPIEERNDAFGKHHYNTRQNNKVAKLFASSSNKQTENEAIYKAINQCLNAVIYNKNSGSIIPKQTKFPVFKYLHYPIIICNSFDKLFRVEMDGENRPVKIDENFQLEINYAYLNIQKKSMNEYFLIDFVEFSKLDSFLSSIEDDVDGIINYVT